MRYWLARAGAPADVFVDEVGAISLAPAGEAGELQRVADHVVGDGNLADDFLQGNDLFAAQNMLEVDGRGPWW